MNRVSFLPSVARIRAAVICPLLLPFAMALVSCESKEQQKVVAPAPVVTASKPLNEAFTDYDEYTGRIEAAERVELRARVGGFLKEIKFEDGAFVKEGELLFIIDQSTYTATVNQRKASLQGAEAALVLAKATLERNRTLVTEGAISQQQFDVMAAEALKAEAEVAGATAALEAANLDLAFTEIKAPFAGRISESTISIGNLVIPGTGGAGTLLATIVSQEPMYAYFDVDENTLLRYRNMKTPEIQGQDKTLKSFNLPVIAALGNEKDFKIQGMMDYGDLGVNPATGSIQVRAVFDNKDRTLVDGLFVRLRVAIAGERKAVLLPLRSIGTDQDRKYVFVLDKDGVAQYRSVRLGAERDAFVVVEEGLAPEDNVVIDGILKLRPGVKPDAKPADLASIGKPAPPPAKADEKAPAAEEPKGAAEKGGEGS